MLEVETRAVVENFDDQPVGAELVGDLHRPFPVGVAVPHRVRARLRHRELEIAERLLVERAQSREATQCEADERDVFRLRGDSQPDRPAF
jgi:hypothetical protein